MRLLFIYFFCGLAGLCMTQEGVRAQRSPVAEFRRWLTLPQPEREQALAAKSAEQRPILRAKLAEYSAMPPDQREARLRLVELHYFLRPLMEQRPNARADGLARIPEELKPIVVERLKQWDALPASLQKQILENESVLQLFVRLQANSAADWESLLKDLPSEKQAEVRQKLKEWEGMPEAQRQSLARHFSRFFELSIREREKTLQILSEEERQEMQRTLQAFEKLPPEQRKACISSFAKFAGMRPEQRLEFLRNVERWQTLAPEDRAAWRNLVKALPPMPPAAEPAPLPK